MDRILPVTVPLNVPRTMKVMEMWGASPWLKVDGDAVWFAQREATGPGTVRMERKGAEVHARGWGPGGEELLEAS